MSSEDEDLDYQGYRPDSFEEVFKASNTTPPQFLPPVSKTRYNKIYDHFQKWNKEHSLGARPISQTVVMDYFADLSEKSKPSTLWAYYSMLKATLRCNDDIDITTWSKLTDFLKRKNVGYKPFKSKVFTEDEVNKFINEAPDEYWLDVACIFGVSGACSTSRLVNVLVEHIKEYDDLYLVTIPKTEASPPRNFTITGSFFGVVKRYVSLRPPHAKDKRFFIHYHEGKCTAQSIGKNKFYKMPQRVAKYLKLPEPERYTGHSFRTTSPSSTASASTYTLNTPAEEAIQQANEDPEFSLDYETGLLITSSNNGLRPVPTAVRRTVDSNEHVCTVKCGQVKCAKEENEKLALHAFSLMKPTDYAITEVTPAIFPSDPICRWIVAYSHFIEPITTYMAEEKFEEITRSIPNNVKVVQRYIRQNSSQLFAAYVVVYGVNCRCLKYNFDPNPAPVLEKFRRTNHDPLSAERSDSLQKENYDPLSAESSNVFTVNDIKFEN